MTNENIEYENKIDTFFINDLKKIQYPKGIEFGVRYGVSTNVSNSQNWKFHKTRDDNFEYLDQILNFKVDLIYLDSFHDANHIKKIFYHYYPLLKIGGVFVFDDISWLPYLKNKKRNNFNCEINNEEMFRKILEIKSANDNFFDLYFSFVGSGLAKIVKKNNETLNDTKKINSRKNSLKNILRKILYLFR